MDGWIMNLSSYFFTRGWTTYLCTNKRRTNLWIGFRILLYDDEEFNHFTGRETLTTLLNQSNQDYIHSRLCQPRLGNCTVGWSFLDLLLLNQMIIHSTKSFYKRLGNQSISRDWETARFAVVWKYEYSPLRWYPLLYRLNSIFNSS